MVFKLCGLGQEDCGGNCKSSNMIKQLLNLLFNVNKESKSNDLQECFDGWKKYRSDLINQKLELEKQIDKTVFAAIRSL